MNVRAFFARIIAGTMSTVRTRSQAAMTPVHVARAKNTKNAAAFDVWLKNQRIDCFTGC
jgi:hypothetical protein